MKRKKIFAALMAGIIMVGSICSSTAQAASKWPKGPDKGSLSSASAIVMELSTGTVLYSKNIHKKHYPASITKIMTSLLTLENSSPSDVVTFTEAEAHGIETGSSSMYCVPGEKSVSTMYTLSRPKMLISTPMNMRQLLLSLPVRTRKVKWSIAHRKATSASSS